MTVTIGRRELLVALGGVGVAARGARAAADAAGWSTSQRIAHYVRAVNDRISPGPSGGRLH
jgi:hypothetical protein